MGQGGVPAPETSGQREAAGRINFHTQPAGMDSIKHRHDLWDEC